MPVTIKKTKTIQSYLNTEYSQSTLCFVSIIYDKHVSWEFCMRILDTVFHKTEEEARAIAHEIVTNGEGFCGGYMSEIAETKAELVESQAKKEGFSLTCLVEEV